VMKKKSEIRIREGRKKPGNFSGQPLMNANAREWNTWNSPATGENASDSRLLASISGYQPGWLRSSKSEIRNPKSAQCNFENNGAVVWSYQMAPWTSGFGFLSDFDLRVSDFNSKPDLSRRSRTKAGLPLPHRPRDGAAPASHRLRRRRKRVLGRLRPGAD
jgi:hypothetical protein